MAVMGTLLSSLETRESPENLSRKTARSWQAITAETHTHTHNEGLGRTSYFVHHTTTSKHTHTRTRTRTCTRTRTRTHTHTEVIITRGVLVHLCLLLLVSLLLLGFEHLLSGLHQLPPHGLRSLEGRLQSGGELRDAHHGGCGSGDQGWGSCEQGVMSLQHVCGHVSIE